MRGRDLAARLGWDYARLANYETGRRTIPAVALVAIVHVLERSPAGLLTDADTADLIDQVEQDAEHRLQVRLFLEALRVPMPAPPSADEG